MSTVGIIASVVRHRPQRAGSFSRDALSARDPPRAGQDNLTLQACSERSEATCVLEVLAVASAHCLDFLLFYCNDFVDARVDQALKKADGKISRLHRTAAAGGGLSQAQYSHSGSKRHCREAASWLRHAVYPTIGRCLMCKGRCHQRRSQQHTSLGSGSAAAGGCAPVSCYQIDRNISLEPSDDCANGNSALTLSIGCNWHAHSVPDPALPTTQWTQIPLLQVADRRSIFRDVTDLFTIRCFDDHTLHVGSELIAMVFSVVVVAAIARCACSAGFRRGAIQPRVVEFQISIDQVGS